MAKQPDLEPNAFYHIYNRANGFENLFYNSADYHNFLRLFEKYISPIADTFAWALMPNHFHFLVSIKAGMHYRYFKEDFSIPAVDPTDFVSFDDVKWETIHVPGSLINPSASAGSETNPSASVGSEINPSASVGSDGVDNLIKKKRPDPAKHFSHLFNAHTKYINKKYNRNGNLFQRAFKRKLIDNEFYLRQVVVYIHNNPVHHGFKKKMTDYPWTSFFPLLSEDPGILRQEDVLNWFGNKQHFIAAHNLDVNPEDFKYWLEG